MTAFRVEASTLGAPRAPYPATDRAKQVLGRLSGHRRRVARRQMNILVVAGEHTSLSEQDPAPAVALAAALTRADGAVRVHIATTLAVPGRILAHLNVDPRAVVVHELPGVAVEAPGSVEDAFFATTELVDRLRRLCRRLRPDAVYAESWIGALASLRATRHLDIPVVVARKAGPAHPWDRLGELPPPPQAGLEQRLVATAAVVCARDEADAREFFRAGASASRVRTVPVGLDLGCFRPAAEPPPARDRPRVGLLVDVVGDEHTRHLSELAEIVPISPPGGLSPGQASGLAGEREPAASGGARVIRRTGRESAEPARLRARALRGCDAVAVIDGGWAERRLALEALACGSPILAGVATDGVDLVEESRAGCRVDLADAGGVRASLAELGERSAVWGVRGREWVRRHHGWDEVATQVGDAVRAALHDA